VKVPALSLCARQDRMVPRCASLALQALQPALQTRWIKGPHMLLQCAPQEAAEAIRSFMQNCASL
jgi:hypothetical protein